MRETLVCRIALAEFNFAVECRQEIVHSQPRRRKVNVGQMFTSGAAIGKRSDVTCCFEPP
jgi:hypothetical protein